jgi:hypothetical protein
MQLKIRSLATPHRPFATETDIPVLVVIELRPLFRHVLRWRHEWLGRHLGSKQFDVTRGKSDAGITLRAKLRRTRHERAGNDKAYPWRTHGRSLSRKLMGRR